MKTLFVFVGTLAVLTFGGHWLKNEFAAGNYWSLAWWLLGVCVLAWVVMHDHERDEIRAWFRGWMR